MRALTLFVFIVSFGEILAGCTSLKATIHMADAEKALKVASGYDAADLATYEYTMAMRYLNKAKEEISYNDHRMAEDLAKKSQEWSDKAIIFIQSGGRVDLSAEDFEFLQDDPSASPVDAPVQEELTDAPTEPQTPPEPDPEDDFDFDEEEEFDMETP